MLNCTITSKTSTKKYENLKSVSIPSVSGYMQIMKGHAESFILMKEGEIVLQSKNGKQSVSILGGECLIQKDDVLIIL